MHKVLIVVLLMGVIVSLFSGLVFLFKDTERTDAKRTWYALGVRITLATALLATIFHGLYTGELQLGKNVRWHNLEGRSSAADVNTPAETAP